MPASPEEQVLIDLLRQGNEDAARQIVDRYIDRLLQLARRRISPRLSSRVDAEDIVQSVYRTFFCRLKDGRFVFEDQDDLCKLLMRITLHKTLRQVAFHKAAKRDPGMETTQGEHHREQLLGLLDREPTPDAAAAFTDHLKDFLSKLDKDQQKVLVLRLEGWTNEDIVEQCNKDREAARAAAVADGKSGAEIERMLKDEHPEMYDRKVRRIVERIRTKAEKEGITLSAGVRS